MTAVQELAAMFDWRSHAVLRRNALVYFRNWKTAFLPPAMEPVVFFLTLGLGLSGYVGALTYGSHTVSYPTFVAPGLIAYAAFGTAFYEALYSSFVRMTFQKTWDGILATQVELSHIVWGEILWAGCRAMMNAAVTALVLGLFHAFGWIHIAWWWLPVLPLIAMVVACSFAACALVFTALVPSIDHMNYPVFLIVVPLSLVSNTYFPVPEGVPVLQAAMAVNPVYHLAETFRGFLVLGRPTMHLLWLALTATVLLVSCTLLVQRLMRRRVLGE